MLSVIVLTVPMLNMLIPYAESKCWDVYIGEWFNSKCVKVECHFGDCHCADWMTRMLGIPTLRLNLNALDRLFAILGKIVLSVKFCLYMRLCSIDEGFLKIARIIIVTIPEGHKTVSTVLWWYHGNTGIFLALILDVLSIPADTKFVRNCLALVSIVWYC